jgi:hypothetical protein
MLEEFITVALEAFTDANGDVDKFELRLRRKLMSYNTTIPQVAKPPVASSPVDNIVSSIAPDDEIFKELEGVDINSLNDEQILALAAKMGLTDTTEENE